MRLTKRTDVVWQGEQRASKKEGKETERWPSWSYLGDFLTAGELIPFPASLAIEDRFWLEWE